LLAFGANGSPAVVMSLVFAGAPIVNAIVTLTLRGDPGEVYVTFDGQVSELLEPGDIIRVRKSRNAVKLVSVRDKNYFGVLRQKLRWAERPRGRRSKTPPTP
jgi:NAD kinase